MIPVTMTQLAADSIPKRAESNLHHRQLCSPPNDAIITDDLTDTSLSSFTSISLISLLPCWLEKLLPQVSSPPSDVLVAE